MSSNGRGRGINNTPAWMNNNNNDRGGPGHNPHDGGPPPNASPGDYGRPRDGNGPPHRGGDYNRGGGGDRYPPRGGGGRRDSYNDHRGGGGFHRGGNNFHRGPRRGSHGGPPGGRRTQGGSSQSLMVHFESRQHERDWVEERRRKRQNRLSKFDVLPSTAAGGAAAGAIAPPNPYTAAGSLQQPPPQQTRHARRLYVGNLPLGVTEDQIQQHFLNAIRTAAVAPLADPDPILSVYINHERRFSFLEFKSVALATACMQLDGLVLNGQALKIKRPNDYNEAAAPPNSTDLPVLDVSRLGIISSNVLDGPNKIFIGGLHYHLSEAQVLELLQAFGKIKAFHLVKGGDDGGGGMGGGQQQQQQQLSKGYCFVEYADPAVTATAIQGLHGMEIGGGKSLTARLAGERNSNTPMLEGSTGAAAPSTAPTLPGAPPANRTIVAGYDIEALIDAAMGQGIMPTAPVYMDAMGLPLTRIVPVTLMGVVDNSNNTAAANPNADNGLAAAVAAAASLPPLPPNMPPPGLPPLPNAATTMPSSTAPSSSRILVLHNMVQDEDLANDEDYHGLVAEVRDEAQKFGTLLSVQIPRRPPAAPIAASAVGKIYLEYATAADAARATNELAGRQFGDAVVEVTPYAEQDYAVGKLM